MLVALVSAKGSPGVTTTALALTASASSADGKDGALLVEADPSGGDLECWCGPLGEPGLLAAVTDIRDRSSGPRLDGLAVDAVPGVKAVTAPTTDVAAGAALRSASREFAEAIADYDGIVVADLGRLASSTARREGLLAAADVVGVVCRPTLASVEHCRALVAALSESTRVAVVVVGGSRPYGPDEISRSVGAAVAGVLPWDVRGVTALVERGAVRAWQRSPLCAAASEVLEHLGARASTASELAYG